MNGSHATGGRLVAVLSAGFALGGLLSACGSSSAGKSGDSGSCRIGFAFSNTTVTLYKPLIAAVNAEAKAKGCTVLQSFANGDAQKQVSDVQTWVGEGVSSIVLLPLDASTVGPVMSQAHKHNIKVVGYAAKLDGEDGSATFGNAEAGKEEGQRIAAWLTAQGLTSAEVAVMNEPTSLISTQRTDGTVAALKAAFPGAKLVSTIKGQTAADGLQAMQSILVAHPNIKVFISGADDAILGANRALASAHKSPTSVLFAAFDGSAQCLQQIQSGTLNAIDAGLNLKTVGKSIADAGYNVVHNQQPLDVVVPYVVISQENKDAATQLLSDNQ